MFCHITNAQFYGMCCHRVHAQCSYQMKQTYGIEMYIKLVANSLFKLRPSRQAMIFYTLKNIIKQRGTLIASNEIEAVIGCFPRKKSPRPDGFISEFYQLSKQELTPMLLCVSHGIGNGGLQIHSPTPILPYYQN